MFDKIIVNAADKNVFAALVGEGVAKQLLTVKASQFANSEFELKFADQNFAKQSILIAIRSTGKANDDLALAMLLLNRLGQASKISVLFTYFPYSRHYDSGNLSAVCNMLLAAGADKLYALDFHQSICDLPIINVSPVSLINDVIKTHKPDCLIWPDEGANRYTLANNSLTFNKIRQPNNHIKSYPVDREVNLHKKSCIIVDDVIHSCNTLKSVAKFVHNQAPRKVLAFVTHLDVAPSILPILSGLNIHKFYTTDSMKITEHLPANENIIVLPIVEVLTLYFKKQLNTNGNQEVT